MERVYRSLYLKSPRGSLAPKCRKRFAYGQRSWLKAAALCLCSDRNLSSKRFGENGIEVKKLLPSLIFNAQLRLDKER
jgi:hypothetical protein